MMNYDTIKTLAKENGLTIGDLCALAPKNDPFYTGRPSELLAANWFTGLWEQYGYSTGVHLRRVHYRIVSQERAVFRPDGKPYQNTQRDWNYLNEASKWARYLGLVPANYFVDRRNPEAIINAHYWRDGHILLDDPRPRYSLYALDDEELEAYRVPDIPQLPNLPTDLPDLPEFVVSGYETIEQPYHVEVWCEKTTMNDVLAPLCQRYRANLVTGAGEMSITACVEFLQRVRQADKPARILYVSDFDPAGLGMPISVARKIEYFQRNEGFEALDVRLQPICLTPEQVSAYDLPRIPVKDSDLRKAQFEADHGQGQVELDALEALYPDQLRSIVEAEINRFRDFSLVERSLAIKRALESRLDDLAKAVAQNYQAELNGLKTRYIGLQHEYGQTKEEFDDLVNSFENDVYQYEEGVADIMADLAVLWERIEAAMADEASQIDLTEEYPLPEPELEPEPETLYVSDRSYVDQLTAYKHYRHGG